MITNQIGQSIPWVSFIRFKGCIRKHFLCTWMLMIGCLKTKAFLTQRNVPCVTICALCGATLESDEHLFLQCLYSLDVWSVLFQKLCLTPQPCNSPIEMIESIASRIDPNHKDLDILGTLVFPAYVWQIWQERHFRIFKGK
eukprot:TRINITY_DN12589_c0_g1_i1.p1 TRINITY_DN12589_c0_g1~~TRINITY_DN12589_c0_g1_i1.p1  ORF type:complete len:141 (-),score=13.26 TRINITY_DN12589_c0_g1_i1:829-1251(-)